MEKEAIISPKLPVSLIKRVKKILKRYGISQKDFVKDALEAFCKEFEGTSPAIIAKTGSKIKDLAEYTTMLEESLAKKSREKSL